MENIIDGGALWNVWKMGRIVLHIECTGGVFSYHSFHLEDDHLITVSEQEEGAATVWYVRGSQDMNDLEQFSFR